MPSPPYNLDTSDPTNTAIVAQYPANERALRATLASYIGGAIDPTTGFLFIQSGTNAQKNALVNPPTNMLFYTTDVFQLWINSGTPSAPSWVVAITVNAGTGLIGNPGGIGNTQLSMTNTGVTAGTYQGITFNAQGQATAAANQGYLPTSGLGSALTGRALTTTGSMTPAGTFSTTGAMMGLGSTAQLTPTLTGMIFFTISGTVFGPSGVFVQSRVGTGSPPANGAGVTGSAYSDFLTIPTPSGGFPATLPGAFRGTVGTTYWFDVVVESGNSSSLAGIGDAVVVAIEF